MIWVILKLNQDIFLLLLACNILGVIVLLVFAIFFANYLSLMENLFISIYISKCLFFFPYFFMVQRNCYRILKAFIIFFIDGVYCCYLFCFLLNQENLYMIHHNSDLFYQAYNQIYYTTKEYIRRKTHYLSLDYKLFWYLFSREFFIYSFIFLYDIWIVSITLYRDIINFRKLHCLLLFLMKLILLVNFSFENITIRTVKGLKFYLDDKIDELPSNESISDIKNTGSRAIEFDSRAYRNGPFSEWNNR